MNQLRNATDSSMTAATKWLQAAERLRISGIDNSSAAPATPARSPMPAPAPPSHSDIRAHEPAAVTRYAASEATPAIRKAMGRVTIIGWMGCLPNVTLLPVAELLDRRRENASFMIAPRFFGGRVARAKVGQQSSYRWLPTSTAFSVPMLLAGCKDAPLSALHGASQQADHIATVWYAMAWGSALIVAFMVVLACVAVWSRSNGENRRRNIVLMAGGGVAFAVVVIS